MAGRARRAGTAALMVMMLTAAVLAVATRVAGIEVLIDQSGSMSPAISAGDVLLSRRIPASSARVGDVVTFPDPELQSRTLTHRIVAIRRSGDILLVTTQGDANPDPEQWTVLAPAMIGRTIRVVPRAGRTIAPLRRPAVAAGTTGVLVTVLVLLVLRRRRSPAVPARR
jgi:signal peptidase